MCASTKLTIIDQMVLDSSEFEPYNIHAEEYQEPNEFGSLFLLVLFGMAMLFCFGAGVVVMAMVILLILGLIAFGILSLSTIIAVYQKSLTSGFKALIITTSTFSVAIFASVIVFASFNIYHWQHTTEATVISVLGGGLAGLGLGLLIVVLIQKLGRLIINKLSRNP